MSSSAPSVDVGSSTSSRPGSDPDPDPATDEGVSGSPEDALRRSRALAGPTVERKRWPSPRSWTGSPCTSQRDAGATASRPLHREKFKAARRPGTAGNGGPGGSVILRVDPDVTHADRLPPQLQSDRADNGGHGAAPPQTGRTARPSSCPCLNVTVLHRRAGQVLADLVGAGTEMTIAPWRARGLGNAALAPRPSARHRASPCSASPDTT
jgi:hypothetical protein